MPYRMNFQVDGGCRRNGRTDEIGVAAIVHVKRWGRPDCWTKRLHHKPTPTNQRAEIEAVIMALETALKIDEEMGVHAQIDVRIYSDSKYAAGCMNDWIYKWCCNGWVNAAGYEVTNRDIIEEASDLEDRVKELGTVKYIWIYREENQTADQLCNDELDEQEHGWW